MADMFVVRRDNTIELIQDMTDAHIRGSYESMSAHIIFRIVAGKVEYAEPDPGVEGIIWNKVKRG